MYIYIEEKILKDKSLSGAEKIVLAFVKLLTEKGKSFYGGASWLAEEFGLQDANSVLLSLLAKKRVIEKNGNMTFLESKQQTIIHDNDIKLKSADDLQADRAALEIKGYELISETESKFVYSNRMNTIHVNKFY